VLKAISRTTFELAPVLDTLNPKRDPCCASRTAALSSCARVTSTTRRRVFGATEEQLDFLRSWQLRSTSGTLVGRAAQTRQVVQIEDAVTTRLPVERVAGVPGFRTMLGVPMLREVNPSAC